MGGGRIAMGGGTVIDWLSGLRWKAWIAGAGPGGNCARGACACAARAARARVRPRPRVARVRCTAWPCVRQAAGMAAAVACMLEWSRTKRHVAAAAEASRERGAAQRAAEQGGLASHVLVCV